MGPLMHLIAPSVLSLQILLLVYVAAIDIATRLIDNEVCLALALLGIVGQLAGRTHVLELLIGAAVLFSLLIVLYGRGWMGGGDVKLLAALALGLPLAGVMSLMTVTALAGAVLALTHLVMRTLPSPRPAPAGDSPAPCLCGRTLAQRAPRAASLRRRHRLRRRLGSSQSGTLTCLPHCAF